MTLKQVFAYFEGDELVAVGTVKQLAEVLGKSEGAVRWYTSSQARPRGKHAVPVTDEHLYEMFTRRHTDAMAEMCAKIVRATRGACRASKIGCDDLGWCQPCYRGACKLVADREREKGAVSDGR